MELSAVISLRDKLSAQMNKASKSVSGMTEKVNKSKEAIRQISASKNISINANSNIAETVSIAKTSIASLQSTIDSKELVLKTHLDNPDFSKDKINTTINELGTYLDKNAGKFDEYSNKLAVLKQKQAEFTDTTKGSTKLGIEQSITSLENKLTDIEDAKRKFAEWQQIRVDFNELELARAELSTLETAIENLNSTNVAVRAYIDFKNDALKQIYDIDNKFQSLGKKIISPVINIKDKATSGIKNVSEKAKSFVKENFSPMVSIKDKASTGISKIRTGIAKVAATVAYPIIKARDAASPLISGVKSKLGGLKDKIFGFKLKVDGKQALNVIKNIGSKFGSLSKKIAKGLTVGILGASTAIAGLGVASVKTGAEFEASMSQVAATMGMTADQANYSNADYALLANTAKELGASTKFSASQAGEALNYLALAGYDAEKATLALPTILDLAAAGGMDLALASDMVTDSMSALGIAATQDNLTAFGDKMAVAAQKSNTSVQQLGEAILKIGGTAKNLAGGTTELNTLLGILADNGTKGSEGGTALRNVLLSLQTPTDVAAKQMKALGLNVYDSQGKMRPLNKVLQDLNKSMDGMTDKEKDNIISTIFNKNDLKSVNALLDNCGDRFDELSGYVENSEGAMSKMAETMSDNLPGRITELKSALEGAGIAIYEALGSSNMKDIVKEASGWITELTEATEKDGINGLVGAVGSVFSKVVTKISSMAPGIISAGVSVVESLLTGIKENLPEITTGIVDALGAFADGFITLAPEILLTGGKIVLKLVQGINKKLPTIIKSGIKAIQKLATGIVGNMPIIIETAVELITTLSNGLVEALPILLPAVIEILMALLTNITANLGPILDAALQILMALVQGLIQSIPILIPAVIEIVMNLLQFITDNLPLLIGSAIEILTTLSGAMIDNIPLLVDAVIQIIQGLITFITENLDVVLLGAIEIILALNKGLIEAIPTLVEGALKLVESIWNTLIETDWLTLGSDIIKGVADGLVSGVKQIGGTIKSVANDVVSQFKNFLGIKSPSRVMKAEVGFHMGTGIVAGLEDTKSLINTEIGSLTNDMTVSVAKNINEPINLSDKLNSKSNIKNNDYSDLTASEPINSNSETNSYSNYQNSSSKIEKHYHFDKIFGSVTVTNEADEDRLFQKFMKFLADEIEETNENMGMEGV